MAKKSAKRKPSKQQEIVIKRLRELGVQVTYMADYHGYILQIPYQRSQPEHIEIGFLMAQLDHFVFPAGYECLSSTTQSEVIPDMPEIKRPLARFVESFPTVMKYRVYLSPDEEQAGDG